MSLQPDGYTFALSPEVTRTPVRYRNQYGIEIDDVDTLHDQTPRSELLVVPGARHIDFYDRTDVIPFDRLDEFFRNSTATAHVSGRQEGARP